jgi:hypothetical protein
MRAIPKRIASALTFALSHPGWIAITCVVAVLLAACTIDDGLTRDDEVQRHMVLGDSALLASSRLDLFRTDGGDAALLRARMDEGVVPWFTDPALRLGFFRPLASLTHAIDYTFLPDHPAWMHLQNLVWYAALVAAAGLLYRRMLGPTWVAGLASAMFAWDRTHGSAVGWIAGRNGLMAGLFCVATMLLRDAASRGWKPGRVLSPLTLALSLLSGELGLGTIAWLVAHALWIDRTPWRNRLASLSAHAAVAVAYAAVWIGRGYGARASGYYVDPHADPWLFLHAVAWNGPRLATMLFVPSALDHAGWPLPLPPSALTGLVLLAAIAFMACLALAVMRDGRARFFATGAALCLVGVSGTFPDDRLLLIASFGAMGLAAQVVGAALSPVAEPWCPRWARPLGWAATVPLLFITLVLSPLGFPAAASQIAAEHRAEQAARRTAPLPDDIAERTIVMLNPPHAFLPASWFLPDVVGAPTPARIRGLTFGPGTVALYRPGERTVVMTPEQGFLNEPVSWLFRRPGTFLAPGETVALSDMTARVETVTADGRPGSVSFEFAQPIEQTGDVWLRWAAGRWVACEVPPVGATAVYADR